MRQKLRDLLYYGEEADLIVETLSNERYFSDKRFAASYTRGKYTYKKWGRNKIVQGLKDKKISARNINHALNEIDPALYQQNLEYLAYKKQRQVKKGSFFQRKGKIAKYLIQRGYESQEVWKMVNRLEEEEE